MSKNKLHLTEEQIPTLVVCSYALGTNLWDAQDYEQEFFNLLDTAQVPRENSFFTRLRTLDSSYFFTKGKLAEVVALANKFLAQEVYISSPLSGMQQRNLEKLLGAKVFDRTDLILKIFKKAAISAEGQLQIELAEIKIAKTKLAGMGREMGQQQFGVGSRGPGETEKEFLMRHYSEEASKAERRLEKLEKVRQAQRKQRLKTSMPKVSLFGYTNAGKSSVLKILSNKDVYVEDKLFATLDTKTREVFLELDKKILLSDTVGFISDLPHHLVRAFQSTLDELRYADLLLHVVDVSNHSWENQIEVAINTLEEIGVDKRWVFVCNKIDLLKPEELEEIKNHVYFTQNQAIFISTMDKAQIQPLKDFLSSDSKLWGNR